MENATTRIPPIASVAVALELASLPRIRSGDVRRLFGCGYNKSGALIKLAREEMRARGRMPYDALCVDTKIAFAAWGIDIENIRHRAEKLAELGFTDTQK